MRDPNADPNKTSSASRDHTISRHDASGVTFLSGGKWTTSRGGAASVQLESKASWGTQSILLLSVELVQVDMLDKVVNSYGTL